jgi:hypothetical protein
VAGVWNGSHQAVDANKDHYVYELLCYFHIAEAARVAFTLRLAGRLGSPRDGAPVARWPKKPGKKTNFSFLCLHEINGYRQRFQLCPGIEVQDKHGKSRAPDGNLLCGDAPDEPTYKHLHACWDAKYSERPGSSIPDTAVSDFAYTFHQLGPPLTPGEWSGPLKGSAFARSGLLTNVGKSSERDDALKEAGISETCNFPDDPKTRP